MHMVAQVCEPSECLVLRGLCVYVADSQSTTRRAAGGEEMGGEGHHVWTVEGLYNRHLAT